MPYAYRPDLLPLAVPTRIGLPWHGLVTNGVLAAGNGKTKTYAQPSGGDAWPVRNAAGASTRARMASEIAHDAATGKVWQNYALIHGEDKQLGGARLGFSEWLYSDPAGTVWLMGVTHTVAGATATFTVKVKKRFGHFANTTDPVPNRTAGTGSLTFSLPDWWDDSDWSDLTASDIAGNLELDVARDLDFTESGAAAVWNLHSTAGGNYPHLAGWVEIAVSGTGSLVAGTYSQGITASLTTHGLDAVWEEWEITVDLQNCPDCPGPGGIVGTVTTVQPSPPAGLNCPADDGTVVVSGEGVTTINAVDPCSSGGTEKWRRMEFVHADGTEARSWYEKTDATEYTVTSGGSETWDAQWGWECDPEPQWIGPFPINCANDMWQTCEQSYYRTTTYGFSLGAESVELINVNGSWSEGTRAYDYECESIASESSAGGNVSTTTLDGDEIDDNWNAVIELIVSHSTNTCWVLGAEVDDAVLHRTILTQDGTREEVPSASGDVTHITYNPKTNTLVWSDDDLVCFV